jgi:uncharacterized membrane protein YfcA
MPDISHLYIASLAALLVGLSKGGLPTVGMLAVPLLSLQISPVKAATLLLPIYVLTDMVSVWLYRREYSKRNLQLLIPAGIAGVLVGWATAAWVSDRFIGLLIGLLGLAFCLNMWLKQRSQSDAAPRVPPASHGVFWGVLAGFTSFVSHAGAPPYQVYVLPQRLPKMVFAGTSTILFAAINAAKIIPYQQLRPYHWADFQTVVWLVPAALLGTVLGAWATRRMNTAWFFRLVQFGLLAVSVKLVWDYFG